MLPLHPIEILLCWFSTAKNKTNTCQTKDKSWKETYFNVTKEEYI